MKYSLVNFLAQWGGQPCLCHPEEVLCLHRFQGHHFFGQVQDGGRQDGGIARRWQCKTAADCCCRYYAVTLQMSTTAPLYYCAAVPYFYGWDWHEYWPLLHTAYWSLLHTVILATAAYSHTVHCYIQSYWPLLQTVSHTMWGCSGRVGRVH